MKGRAACLAIFALTLMGTVALPQVVRLHTTPRVTRPQLSLGSLTLSATPANINFTLVPGGIANGSSAVSITTTAASLGVVSGVSLYAYFSSTSALNDGAGDTLPTSAIYGMDPSGSPTSFTAFTQTTPFSSGSGLLLFSTSNVLSLGSGRTDNLSLRINLANQPTQAAGTYNGTLVLQAQTF